MTFDRIGLGTVNPQADFHLVGNSIVQGNVTIGLSSVANNPLRVASTGNTPTVYVTQDGTNGIYAAKFEATTTAAHGVHIKTAANSTSVYGLLIETSTASIVVSSNGRMGIGTNAPAESLHVVGNVRVTGTLSVANFNPVSITASNLSVSTLSAATIRATTISATTVLANSLSIPILAVTTISASTISVGTINAGATQITTNNASYSLIGTNTTDNLLNTKIVLHGFSEPVSGKAGSIDFVTTGGSGGDITFMYQPSVGSAISNMVISKDGRVGIGTNVVVSGVRLGVLGSAVISGALTVSGATILRNTLSVTGPIVANGDMTIVKADVVNVNLQSTSGSSTNQQNIRFKTHAASRGGGLYWENTASTGFRTFFGRNYNGGSNITGLSYKANIAGGNTDTGGVTHLFINDADGNVGIGTTNPTVKLQVSGAIKAYALSAALITADSLLFSSLSVSGELSVGTGVRIASGNLVVNSGNVGVGIGTGDPRARLEVANAILINGGALPGNEAAGIFFRPGYVTSSKYNLSIMNYDHSGDGYADGLSINGYDGISFCTGSNTRSEKMRVDSNGNVGIGNTAPTSKLHVAGTANITSNLSVASLNVSGNVNIDSGTLFVDSSANNVGIGTTGPTSKLHVIGTANISLNLSVGSMNTSGTVSATTVLVGTSLGIGTTTLSDSLVVNGAIRSRNESSGFAQGGGTAAIMDMVLASKLVRFGSVTGGDDNANSTRGEVGLHVNNVERMRINSSGNVGIGVSTPAAKLHVVGAAIATSLSTTMVLSSNVSVSGSMSAAAVFAGNVSVSGSMSAAAVFAGNVSVSGSVNIDSGTLFVNGATGNVGIGTTTPGASLEVANSILINGGALPGNEAAGIFFRPGFVTENIYNMSILNYNHSGSVGDGLSINGYDGISFCTGSNSRSERMRVDSSGNVGIGTTAPAANLHLYTNSTSVDTTLLIQSDKVAKLILQGDDANTGSPETGGAMINLTQDGGGTRHVVSTIQVANTLPDGTAYAGAGTNSLLIGSVVEEAIQIGTNSVVRITIDSTSGYVGIGSAPGTQGKLAVFGGEYRRSSGYNVGSLEANNPGNGVPSDSTFTNTNVTRTIGIYTDSAVYAVKGYGHASDIRIKRDIEDVNDGEALISLRNIEPRKYRYIDQQNENNTKVIGFIAQQVAQHLSEAVFIKQEVIPDIYQACVVDISTRTIILPANARSGKMRAVTKIGRVVDFLVNSIDNDTVRFPEGEITTDDLLEGKLFVYGYEVDDFHALNKDYLFTINFAATQELDRKVSRLEQENAELRAKLDMVLAKLNL